MLCRPAAWCCVALLFTGAAWSQVPSAPRRACLSTDLYAGYSLVAPDFGDYNSNPVENGLGGGADLHLSRLLALAGEAYWMHVTYNPEESSSSVNAFGGPRFFFSLGSDRAITPFADVLGGVVTFNFQGNPSPFTSTLSPALATDAGMDLRITRALALRVQGGYVRSSFTSTYAILQTFVHDQHGRLLVEAVWHF